MRTLTEVGELALFVEGERVLVGRFGVEDVLFVLVVLVEVEGLLSGFLDALDVEVLGDDVAGLALDVREVVAVEFDARDVVVEPFVGPRADGEFRFRVELFQRRAKTWAAE